MFRQTDRDSQTDIRKDKRRDKQADMHHEIVDFWEQTAREVEQQIREMIHQHHAGSHQTDNISHLGPQWTA